IVAAFANIGLLRQQLRDSARVHGIIIDGGQAVNVIPHHTAAKLLIRSEDDDYMDEVLKPKVLGCFEGAAVATGCELKYRWGEESRYKAMRTNRALAARRDGGPDRKSTRLNSSHVATSYAVFCLKKKSNCALR